MWTITLTVKTDGDTSARPLPLGNSARGTEKANRQSSPDFRHCFLQDLQKSIQIPFTPNFDLNKAKNNILEANCPAAASGIRFGSWSEWFLRAPLHSAGNCPLHDGIVGRPDPQLANTGLTDRLQSGIFCKPTFPRWDCQKLVGNPRVFNTSFTLSSRLAKASQASGKPVPQFRRAKKDKPQKQVETVEVKRRGKGEAYGVNIPQEPLLRAGVKPGSRFSVKASKGRVVLTAQ